MSRELRGRRRRRRRRSGAAGGFTHSCDRARRKQLDFWDGALPSLVGSGQGSKAQRAERRVVVLWEGRGLHDVRSRKPDSLAGAFRPSVELAVSLRTSLLLLSACVPTHVLFSACFLHKL